MTIQTNTAKFNNAGITVAYTDNSGAAVTQNITFANKTTSLDSGLNVTAGNAVLSGALNVTGSTNLNAALNVAGVAALHNTLLVDGAATANSSFAVAGAANAANVMNVTGASAIHSTLVVDQASVLGSTLITTGAAALNSTLAVAGVTNLNNVLNAANTVNLGAELNVASGATLTSAMDVIGASHMHDTLLVDGVMAQPTLTAYNGSVPLDNAHVTYTLYNSIGGSLTVPQDADGAQLMSLSFFGTGALNSGNMSKAYFNIPVPGNDGIWFAAGSNQLITFDFTFGNTSSYTLTAGQQIGVTVSTLSGGRYYNMVRNPDESLAFQITYKKAAGVGAAAVNLGNTLTVGGATVFNNNLTVNGTAALNGAITISGALGMGGSGTVGGAVTLGSTFNAVGAAHLKSSIQVDGATTMGGSLALTGAANLGNILNVAGVSHLSTLLVDQALTANGASQLNNTLGVSGAASLANTLSVVGAATMNNTLGVSGAATMQNTFNVVGAATMNNTLGVVGAATVGGSLDITGVATVNNALNVTGASAIGGSLGLTGAVIMANTLGVVGAATMGSSLNVAGVSNVNSTLAVSGATIFQNNVTINGNITVLGNQTAIDTVSLQVKDNAVLIGDGNISDAIQSGIQLQYQPSGASAPKYAGMKRLPISGSTGGEFVFFKDSASKITEPVSSSVSAGVSVTGEYVELDLGTSTQISLYGLCPYESSMIFSGWTIAGSNDNSTWYLVDSRTNNTLPINYQATIFNVTTSAYRYYRLIIQNFQLTNTNDPWFYRFGLVMKDMSGNFLRGTAAGYSPTWVGAQPWGASIISIGLNQTYNIGSVGPSIGGGYSRSAELNALFNGPNYAYTGSVMTSINTPAPAIPADIYAAIIADSFKCASDKTLKKNINILDGSLDKLDKMRGVYHGWIDENQSQDRQIGVIAQEVQSVYPELISVGGNGYLSVNYPKLTAVLLQSVKELKVKVMEIAAKRKAQ